MDFEGVMLGEISDGERQIPYDFTHTWKLKKKNQQQTDTENSLLFIRGESLGGGEMDKRVIWMVRDHSGV